jgi:hypothetical protein
MGCVLPQDNIKWDNVVNSGTFPQWDPQRSELVYVSLSQRPDIVDYLASKWFPFSLNPISVIGPFLFDVMDICGEHLGWQISGELPEFQRVYGIETLADFLSSEETASWIVHAKEVIGPRLQIISGQFKVLVHSAAELVTLGLPCMISPFEHVFQSLPSGKVTATGIGEDFSDLCIIIPSEFSDEFDSRFEPSGKREP